MRRCTICHEPLETCRHVPSPKYDIFITAFEKYVAERQKEIARIDGLHRPYEIVRAALERAKLPNSTKLLLMPDLVRVEIGLNKENGIHTFIPLLRDIGMELVMARLREDGVPALDNQSAFSRTYEWKLVSMPRGEGDAVPKVKVHLSVPYGGTDYVKISKEDYEVRYTDTKYTATWLEQHEVTHAIEEVRPIEDETF